MNTKEYLSQAHRLNELIDSDLEELKNLRLLSTSISSPDASKDIVKSSKGSDKIGGIVSKIVDLDNHINEEIDNLVDLKAEIRQRISQIPTKDERLVLQNRYLNFMTWERLAEKLGFTRQWVQEIHKRALANFENMFNL